MKAFIAMNKYIVNEINKGGAGVPVAFDEEIAKTETCKQENIQSYNEWLEINIPEAMFFLETTKSMKNQNANILECLRNEQFLTTLFVTDARRLYNNMEKMFKPNIDKNIQIKKILSDFCDEKYKRLLALPTGFDLIHFINDRCKTHDMKKSSALLYNAGIKGALYCDKLGQRILIYDASKDILPVAVRSERL